MFYFRQTKEKFFVSSDHIFWEYGPFDWIFCKNQISWNVLENFDFNAYPAYKYAIGFTKKRIFILEESGKIQILTFNK